MINLLTEVYHKAHEAFCSKLKTLKHVDLKLLGVREKFILLENRSSKESVPKSHSADIQSPTQNGGLQPKSPLNQIPLGTTRLGDISSSGKESSTPFINREGINERKDPSGPLLSSRKRASGFGRTLASPMPARTIKRELPPPPSMRPMINKNPHSSLPSDRMSPTHAHPSVDTTNQEQEQNTVRLLISVKKERRLTQLFPQETAPFYKNNMKPLDCSGLPCLNTKAWGVNIISKDIPYSNTIREFQAISKRKNPYHKARTLVSTIASISEDITRFYRKHKELEQPHDLGADDITPIFSFIITMANVPNIHAQIRFISQFSDMDTLRLGEFEHKLTLIITTSQFISTLLLNIKDISGFLVSRQVFDKKFFNALEIQKGTYTSKNKIPPPTAWMSELLLDCATFISEAKNGSKLELFRYDNDLLESKDLLDFLQKTFKAIDINVITKEKLPKTVFLQFTVRYPPHLYIHFSRLIEKEISKSK